VLDNTDGKLFVLIEAVLASLIPKLEILLLRELVLHFEFVHVDFDLIIGTIVVSDVLFLGVFLFIYIHDLRGFLWLAVIP
jgi:hypothetical protein